MNRRSASFLFLTEIYLFYFWSLIRDSKGHKIRHEIDSPFILCDDTGHSQRDGRAGSPTTLLRGEPGRLVPRQNGTHSSARRVWSCPPFRKSQSRKRRVTVRHKDVLGDPLLRSLFNFFSNYNVRCP